MKMRMKRMMGLFLALVMSIGCLSLNPIASYAEDADPNTFNINERSVNITQSGNYTIEGTGQSTSNTISVTGNNIKATITLHNVNIDVSNRSWQAAFLAKNNDQSKVHLTIILKGTNSLKSGSNCAGLTWNNSDNNSKLEIKGDGSLTATGGEYGAGIGSIWRNDTKNITIAGGTVTAASGRDAAGIGGGGNGGLGENITITGGTVTATGWQAGIGGNRGGKNITITGGTITATGGDAGIGGGWESGENITITGGTVTATGGVAGIGTGNGSLAKNITITGGSVTATGGGEGAGIGGGYASQVKNITITGGSVTATGGDAGIGGSRRQSSVENIKITGGSVKAHSISTTPTDSNGNSVYLAKLENQDGVNEVTVDSGTENKKTFKRAGNHPDGDTAFYLYLTGQEYKLVTSKGKYKAEWNSTTKVFTIIEFINMVVKGQPKKLTYTEGDNLNLDGLVVTLTDIDNNPKDVPFAQFTNNNITTDPENGTRLIAANHNNAKVKLTYKNLIAYTDPLTVKAKYKVTYKDGVNGEAFQDQVKSIVSGADTPAFTGTPTRAGYVFDKWSPNPAGTKVTADATYTATWKEDKNGDGTPDDQQEHFTVTYKDGVNGKAFADQVKSIVTGADTPAFTGTPTRTGYIFDKWSPDVADKVTADAIYVAQWKKDHFTVTFKDGDKTQTVKVKNGKAIDTDELIDQSMPKNPTKAGYTFKEWNTKEDGKGTEFTGASVVNGDMTVYAIYTKDPVPNPDPTPNPPTPTPELKPNPQTPAPQPQPKKHIGMISKTGESASFAGLLTAIGFSIAGLAILLKKKMMEENK